MTDELEKKVRQSVSLIQKAVGDKVVEVAYSGGKDSDIILELTKMAACVNARRRKCTNKGTTMPMTRLERCFECVNK